jgi:adhesin/invasin
VKRQRLIFTSLVTLSACVSSQALAQSAPGHAAPAVGGLVDNAVRSGLVMHNAPDWLKRTDISVQGITSGKPTWSIETIQPLYQTPQSLTDTVFFQGRWGRRDGDDTLNLGLGYRRLLDDKSWLLGVNAFYDVTRQDSHRRAGLGLEAIGRYITLRTNYYDGLSGVRTVSSSGGSSTTEKALDGVDYELDTPVPYAPWLRFSATGFRWNAATSGYPNLKGETFLLRGNLSAQWSLELGRTNDNYNSGRNFARVTWNPGASPGNGISGNLMNSGSSRAALQARDLTLHTLDKVRRQNDMIVEQKSGGIVIARKD